MIDEIMEILPILIPLVLIEIAIRIYAIIDIFKEERETLLLSKKVWAIIVALINFGWVVYLVAGRKDKTFTDQ